MSEHIQDALKSLLKTLPDLADTDSREKVTRADTRVLDMGFDYAAVIWPGQVQSGDASGWQVTRVWDIPFDLFVRYTNNADTHAELTGLRDSVIDLLDTHPTLGGLSEVTLEMLATTADPEEVHDRQGGGPYFLMQPFRLQITERVALSGGEYV